jgi:cell division protein FtsI (penicillin-binding protein 3)
MSDAITKDEPDYLWRYRLVLVMLMIGALFVAARLLQLHVLDQDFLSDQGDKRMLRQEKIPAFRGMIVDRNGEPLAVSTPVMSLWLNPQQLPNKETKVSANKRKQEIKALAKALNISTKKLSKRIDKNKDKEFMYLKRHMSPIVARKIIASQFPGVHEQQEYKRFYPAAEVTAHILGFTNIDEKGQEGLELAYEDWLTGEDGSRQVIKDRRGNVTKDLGVLSEASPGKSLTLSIDLRLQYLAHRELKKAMAKHSAKSASLVMMDAKTGEVLAMASQPSYNPNNRRGLNVEHLRNRAMIDLIEPGSTIKPMTVAAALETGRYTPGTRINTAPGYLRVEQKTVRDHRNYGMLDLTGIIKKSSNVGVSKLALDMPGKDLRGLLYRAGLGQTTATGFPGEVPGRLPARQHWSDITLATMSYGYGISVTPLQLAQAYTLFTNNGKKIEASLLKREGAAPQEQVISSKTANQVLSMLETVTQKGGTATRARVTAYRVGGKTGTVHQVGRKGYEEEKYSSLFAGIAPISSPKIIAVIVVNDPKGDEYYGGEVAAPIFSHVVEQAVRILDIAPDENKTLREQAVSHFKLDEAA